MDRAAVQNGSIFEICFQRMDVYSLVVMDHTLHDMVSSTNELIILWRIGLELHREEDMVVTVRGNIVYDMS